MDADPQVAAARRVLRCLARHPELHTFTRRDVYQHLRGSFERPEALDAPLGLLLDHHYLRVVPQEGVPRPGPRTDRYEVNPLWDRREGARITQITQDPAGEG